MITHGALSNYLSWANDTYIQGETHAMALFTSISFDLTITSMFLPLISGNTLYVYQQKEQSALIEQVVRDGYATILKLTPSHLKILSESDVDIRSVKRLIVGGEQFSADLAAAIFDKGNIALEIYNEYGPTEATIGCVLHQYSREESFLRSSVLIGKPAPNNHVYVLDRHLNLLPIGVAGELYIGGAQLFKGYISSEDQTRAKLIGNPYRENDMLYKAGDLVRCLADGNLEFLGRIDDQVKVRGYRIELGEIESMLSGYDNVRDSVVLVKDSEGDKHLIAYYVSDDEISSAKLRSYLSLRLPEYMLPAYYMHLERLPLTANGKLDRKALPEPQLVDDNYMAPSLGFEERLVDIWSEVLRIERSKISVNRNFFDLGGDSIRLIYLANKLKKDFKVKLSIAALFNAPTILSQASMLDNAFEESSRTQFHIEQETETRDETLNLLDSINN
jgi:acyl-coenzyme A synthetase/AMP-(fatty) acid ligase/acyl carrier protein